MLESPNGRGWGCSLDVNVMVVSLSFRSPIVTNRIIHANFASTKFLTWHTNGPSGCATWMASPNPHNKRRHSWGGYCHLTIIKTSMVCSIPFLTDLTSWYDEFFLLCPWTVIHLPLQSNADSAKNLAKWKRAIKGWDKQREELRDVVDCSNSYGKRHIFNCSVSNHGLKSQSHTMMTMTQWTSGMGTLELSSNGHA